MISFGEKTPRSRTRLLRAEFLERRDLLAANPLLPEWEEAEPAEKTEAADYASVGDSVEIEPTKSFENGCSTRSLVNMDRQASRRPKNHHFPDRQGAE